MNEAPQTTLISVDIDGACCRIMLSRQEKYNAMNEQMISELIEVFNWSADNSVARKGTLSDDDGNPYFRILTIGGEGKHFCAGADINMMRDAGAKTPEQNREDSRRLDALFNGLWSHPCFTIGVIQGVALGGGAGLIACMDHVIALEGTRIALSEGKLGILPAVIGPYVYRRVGSACFRRLAMQASRIKSDEALRVGMIEQVVNSTEEASTKVDEIIAEVMTTGPMAVASAKELSLGFDRWTSSDEELRQWTLDFTSRMRGGDEGQEGLSSFLEGREANWKNGSN